MKCRERESWSILRFNRMISYQIGVVFIFRIMHVYVFFEKMIFKRVRSHQKDNTKAQCTLNTIFCLALMKQFNLFIVCHALTFFLIFFLTFFFHKRSQLDYNDPHTFHVGAPCAFYHRSQTKFCSMLPYTTKTLLRC